MDFTYLMFSKVDINIYLKVKSLIQSDYVH